MTNTNAGAEGANELKVGVHYNLFKDGHGVEHKIAIADHPLFAPRSSGFINVESFRGALNNAALLHNQGERSDIETFTNFKTVLDKATKLWFGEPIGVSQSDKSILWKKFPLKRKNIFDLSKTEDRIWWSRISRSNIVEGSPNQNQKPLFKVIDSVAKSEEFIEKLTLRERAIEVIRGMSPNQMREFAPSLGINAGNYDDFTLKAEFLRYNEDNSKKFLEIWDNPAKETIVQFKKAFSLGIVKREVVDGQFLGYSYGQYKLGLTESECVSWLSDPKHSSVFSSIVVNSQEKENSIHRGNSKVSTTEHKADNALAKENEDLKRKLAALEAKQKDVSVPEKSSIKESVVEETKSAEVDELTSLKARAKELKIKGYHVMSNPNTLRQKIAEAEAAIV